LTPLRVLHVMEATIGGTRRHLRDLAAGQARLGLEVHVVAAAEREPAVRGDFERLREAGVQVTELPMVRAIRPALDRRQGAELARILERVRPTVVHTHSSKGGALGRWASLRTGIGRRVHTPHTFSFLFDAMFSGARRRLFRSIEWGLGRCTHRVIAVSAGEAETIRRSRVIPERILRVVPNGIDPAPWRAAAAAERHSLGVPEGVPLGVVVGLLNPAKGQDLLLRALAEPGCERLHLLVVGHGDDEPALRALCAELRLESRVHFTGWREDVPALVAAADLLCLPSRWEGLPYAVLEAMAAGRPVVATAVDGARELVEDGATGFLCPVGSVPALGAALARLLALPPAEQRRLGRAGAERFERGYTAEQMVAGTVAVYGELR
jgi:glycosyltransferase involved in cell wall biosynthesis